nr:niemann-pick c1 protein [Quercus suber]
MASSLGFLLAITLFQVILFTSLLSAEKLDTGVLSILEVKSGERHSEEYCAMYDICGERSDGKVLNCPYGSPSVKPDELLSAKIQSLCPTISGNVCCTETQFDTLRAQVQQAIPFLVGCPACLRNFLNLFCELSCSPNQSLFINVTSIAEFMLRNFHFSLEGNALKTIELTYQLAHDLLEKNEDLSALENELLRGLLSLPPGLLGSHFGSKAPTAMDCDQRFVDAVTQIGDLDSAAATSPGRRQD